MKFFADTNTNTSTMVEVALHCAERNIPVVPASYSLDSGRISGVLPTAGMNKDTATTSHDEICELWKTYPNALVLVPTGKKSGLVVIRVAEYGQTVWERWVAVSGLDMATIACQETPDALEYIFKAPQKTIYSAKMEEGIEILGEGESFVIAPAVYKTRDSQNRKIEIKYEVISDFEPADIPDGLLDKILETKAGINPKTVFKADMAALTARLEAKAGSQPLKAAMTAERLKGGAISADTLDGIEPDDIAELSNQDEEEAFATGLPRLPLDALPKNVAKIISEAAGALNTDEWLPFAALLQTASTIVGANVMLQHRWKSPGHIWLCLVGRPSMGKSTVTGLFSKILRDTEKVLSQRYTYAIEQYAEDIEEWKQERAAAKKQKESFTKRKPLQPLEESLYVNDTTIEKLKTVLADNPGGLSWINDELDSLLSGFNRYTGGKESTTKSDLLSMYMGSSLKVSRRNAEAQAYIPEAWIGIFGTTQYGKLADMFKKEDRASGFLQRFMFICAEKKAPIPYHMRKTTESLEGEIYNLFKVMYDGVDRLTLVRPGEREEGKHIEPRLVRLLDDKAQSAFENYLYRIETEAYALSGEGTMAEREEKQSREQRWCDQFPRLLLLLHAIESASVGKRIHEHIPHETVENAIKIFQAMTGHCEYTWELIKGKTRQDTPPVELIKIVDKYMEKGREYVLHYAKTMETGEKIADTILEEIGTVTKGEKTKKALSKSLESIGFVRGRTKDGIKYTIAPEKYQKLLNRVDKSQKPSEIEPVCPPASREKENIVDVEIDHFLLTSAEQKVRRAG